VLIMLPCIITAAGLSKRFDGNKLLFKYDKLPLIIQTINNAVLAKSIDKIIVVTGYMRSEIEDVIRETIHDERLIFVHNPEYDKGMSSSIKAGLSYLMETSYNPEAVMINPGDSAWIPSYVYDYLVYYFEKNRSLITVAGYRGKKGHPILFSKLLLKELLKIDESSKGLKKILEKYSLDISIVETFYPGVLLDFDEYLDYMRVKNTLMR